MQNFVAIGNLLTEQYSSPLFWVSGGGAGRGRGRLKQSLPFAWMSSGPSHSCL